MHPLVRELGQQYLEHIDRLTTKITELEQHLHRLSKDDETAVRLQTMPGIGPITAAAIEAFAPPMATFRRGRDFAAWLGLVPRQHSSGGKSTLLGMSKRGNAYLRTLLIHGARSAILAAQRKTENTNLWLANLLSRRHPNIAAVALANKNVRAVWAILAHGREFKANYVPARMAA